MLYDPKWEVRSEAKPDPFKLESLIVWLETKDPDDIYDYTDSGSHMTPGCMLCQYFRAAGMERAIVSPDGVFWGIRREHYASLSPRFDYIARAGNFGGALRRARACRLLLRFRAWFPRYWYSSLVNVESMNA